jgi:hypothetical protein
MGQVEVKIDGPPSGKRRSETRRENYQCSENAIDLYKVLRL